MNALLSRRARNVIELVGHVFFLIPTAAMILFTSWLYFLTSYAENEQSSNAGGLPQWPIKALIPVAFALLFAAGPLRADQAHRHHARPIPETKHDGGYHGAAAGAAILAPPAERSHRGSRSTMAAFLAQNLAPIMFAALVVILLLGYPVAFSLGAVGLMFFVVGVELAPYSDGAITLSWPLLESLPGRIYDVMRNDTLLAIPFFTFMGLILERSGMAEDLLDTVGQLFGTVRGGLAYAVIFVGALLAATTGVVAASVISMGLISLPIMLRYGYDRRLALGVIAASGTLAQIIPPSLVLIVLADQLGRSVDDMYKGALLPGLMLAGLYALYVFVVRRCQARRGAWVCRRATSAPQARRLARPPLACGPCGPLGAVRRLDDARARPIPPWTSPSSAWRAASLLRSPWPSSTARSMRVTGRGFLSPLAERVTFVMVPPLLLIFLVLGTILVGVATPTEGGAMGAVGAMALASGGASPADDDAPVQPCDRAAGRRSDGQARRLRHVHSHRRAHLLAHLLRRERPHLGRAPARPRCRAACTASSSPSPSSCSCSPSSSTSSSCAFILVPLLKPAAETIFRNAPEAVAIAKSGRSRRHHRDRQLGRDARDRGRRDAVRHLVRRAARGQHADELHASAVRIRALLPALRGAEGSPIGTGSQDASRHR